MRAQSDVLDPASIVRRLRTGAKPEHTKQNLARPQILYCRFPAAESLWGPISDCKVERIHRERVAVNPLHTVVLCVFKHQTVVQSKLTLVQAMCPADLFQFQYRKTRADLKNNDSNWNNLKNSQQNKKKLSSSSNTWKLLSNQLKIIVNKTEEVEPFCSRRLGQLSFPSLCQCW